MKLALCLAGGGIKGAAHIGAIKALEEENINISYIGGTSSGSIIATLYACGFTTSEMYNIFKRYAKEIKYIDSKNLFEFIKDLITFKGFRLNGLNSGDKIYNLVKEICNTKNIKNINQIKLPLVIPSVSLYDEKLYVFSNNIIGNKSDKIKYINDVDIAFAVRASCSYPGVFSPCEYNGSLLVDGGIAENLPWRETKRAGADKVISIVFNDVKPQKCLCNLFDIISKSFTIIFKELANYEWDGTDYLIKIEFDKKIKLLDTKQIEYLYKEGYIQTKRKIRDIKKELST